MVALKAELGPLVPGVPGVSGPSWDLFVAAGSDALPGTGTNLGTFNHNEAGDQFSKGLNHVVYHHLRDIMYRRKIADGSAGVGPFWPYGFHDMSQIRIRRHGAILTSTAMTAASVSMAVAGTATLVIKGQPGDVAVANADCSFISANPAIATVVASGLVTGQAAGNTVVTVTNKFNGLVVDAPVTVTAVQLLEGRSIRDEDIIRNDDEQPDNRQSVIDAEEMESRVAEVGQLKLTASKNREENQDESQEGEAEVLPVTEINGIGPAMEARLHEAGITSLQQIAELRESEAEELDTYLGLGGRITRDNWVQQARDLLK